MLHVQSASLDWLVVTTKDTASFQGLATVDKTGTLHPFRVDLYDGARVGGADTFRLRIGASGANPAWAAPIHDFGPLDGGNILIR